MMHTALLLKVILYAAGYLSVIALHRNEQLLTVVLAAILALLLFYQKWSWAPAFIAALAIVCTCVAVYTKVGKFTNSKYLIPIWMIPAWYIIILFIIDTNDLFGA